MAYLDEFQKAFEHVMCTSEENLSYDAMLRVVFQLLDNVKKAGRVMYFVGNGGSAAIAIHMTNDFLKNGGIRTHSMHDPATLTCLGNDFGFEEVFSRQLDMVADEGDVLVAISSSGKSPNILRAVESAQRKQCNVIALSGFQSDNPLHQMGDISIYVPSMKYGIVESVHNLILQQLVDEMVSRDGVGMK